jgi:hypothetical protein
MFGQMNVENQVPVGVVHPDSISPLDAGPQTLDVRRGSIAHSYHSPDSAASTVSPGHSPLPADPSQQQQAVGGMPMAGTSSELVYALSPEQVSVYSLVFFFFFCSKEANVLTGHRARWAALKARQRLTTAGARTRARSISPA